jgi:hypothetical protein
MSERKDFHHQPVTASHAQVATNGCCEKRFILPARRISASRCVFAEVASRRCLFGTRVGRTFRKARQSLPPTTLHPVACSCPLLSATGWWRVSNANPIAFATMRGRASDRSCGRGRRDPIWPWANGFVTRVSGEGRMAGDERHLFVCRLPRSSARERQTHRKSERWLMRPA